MLRLYKALRNTFPDKTATLAAPPRFPLCSLRRIIGNDALQNVRTHKLRFVTRRPSLGVRDANVRTGGAPLVLRTGENYVHLPDPGTHTLSLPPQEKPAPPPQSARTRASSAHSHRQPSPRGVPTPVVKRLDMSLVNQAKILELTAPERKLSARGARKPVGSQPGGTDAKAMLPPIAADGGDLTARNSWRKRVV